MGTMTRAHLAILGALFGLAGSFTPAQAEKLYFRVAYNLSEERRYPDGSQGYLPTLYSLEIYTDDATGVGFVADSAYAGGSGKAGRGGQGVKVMLGRTSCKNTVPYRAGGDVDLSKVRTRKCFAVSGSGGTFTVREVATTTFTNSSTVLVGTHDYTVFKTSGGCSVTVNQAERSISDGAFVLTGRKYFSYGPTCSSQREGES